MGVKQLWTLLSPVGRPVLLETMEGKVLAIDSSIWLYQFQATMRDKDGKALLNAHVLGFLRRICKLLFYGIKPVFVFDGGAPALKKSTINERRKRKSGAAASHARVAEKLLAAQMRREALKHAQGLKARQTGESTVIDQNAVFFEDLIGPNPAASRKTTLPSAPSAKFRDHDPYRLPDIDYASVISKATSSSAPDPRLATEDELRDFIETMRPEDFDAASPAFRELPTEVQYEIIGDLRLKSRQTSFHRLQDMLRKAPSPMDFSKAQIKGLQQRNNLTQQLLQTTSNMGSTRDHHLTVRVASERNREYVLIKNDVAHGGGWILGLRDTGTRDKPIEIDIDPPKPKNENDSDEDMEEVVMEEAPYDPDYREHRRQENLSALANRDPSRHRQSKSKSKSPAVQQLFATADEDDEDPELLLAIRESMSDQRQEGSFAAGHESEVGVQSLLHLGEEDDDIEMLRVMELSKRDIDQVQMDEQEDANLQRAMAESRRQLQERQQQYTSLTPFSMGGPSYQTGSSTQSTSSSSQPRPVPSMATSSARSLPPPSGLSESDEDDLYYPKMPSNTISSGLPPSTSMTSPTLLSAAGSLAPTPLANSSSGFGRPSSILMERDPLPLKANSGIAPSSRDTLSSKPASGGERPVSIPFFESPPTPLRQTLVPLDSTKHAQAHYIGSIKQQGQDGDVASTLSDSELLRQNSDVPYLVDKPTDLSTAQDSDDDMEEVHLGSPQKDLTPNYATTTIPPPAFMSQLHTIPELPNIPSLPEIPSIPNDSPLTTLTTPRADQVSIERSRLDIIQAFSSSEPRPHFTPPKVQAVAVADDSEGEIFYDDWSRSPSPALLGEEPEVGQEEFTSKQEVASRRSKDVGDWDAAQEMDPIAEEDEFAKFLSQVKGKDLGLVQQEIEQEITTLNKERKIAARDSDDITQHMISQIMVLLRLFGIPYITAPMEAEAQCATLVTLSLVEGIITDDSDVFLFGGARVFRNMFNQSKTVECFLMTDLARELSLDRDKLVRLAYLLGSDYVDGLPGVGPVVAMELLKEFPGEDGLHKFKEWWLKVQSGRDKPEDNKSAFKKRFKKKFKALHLTNDWPNPHVRDAYYQPTVDDSREPFKWGLPDLDALRDFLDSELSWNQAKVDELLLPIIRKIGQRGQAQAANKQGTLDSFFDVSVGAGTYAPRKRQAYASKRLQKVVSDFRQEQREEGSSADNDDGEDESRVTDQSAAAKTKAPRKRPQPKKAVAARKKRKVKKATASPSGSEHEEDATTMEGVTGSTVELRPRKARTEAKEQSNPPSDNDSS